MRPPHRGRALAALACVSALALGACGGDEPPEQAGPLGTKARLQQVQCSDWRAASIRERMLTVDRLEEVSAGPRKEGRTLPDERAYDILDARCKAPYAPGFLLYHIYTRAAAFEPTYGGG